MIRVCTKPNRNWQKLSVCSLWPPPSPAFCGLQEQLFAYLLPKREKRGEQLRSQNTMTRWGCLHKDSKLWNKWGVFYSYDNIFYQSHYDAWTSNSAMEQLKNWIFFTKEVTESWFQSSEQLYCTFGRSCIIAALTKLFKIETRKID